MASESKVGLDSILQLAEISENKYDIWYIVRHGSWNLDLFFV